MIKRLFLLFFSMILGSCCTSVPGELILGCAVPTDKPGVALEKLLDAPTELKTDNALYMLRGWYKIKSSSRLVPCSSCINVTLKFNNVFAIREAVANLPANYEVKKIWIINETKKQVWEITSFENETIESSNGDKTVYYLKSGGPEWRDEKLIAVTEIVSSADQKILLRAREIPYESIPL